MLGYIEFWRQAKLCLNDILRVKISFLQVNQKPPWKYVYFLCELSFVHDNI